MGKRVALWVALSGFSFVLAPLGAIDDPMISFGGTWFNVAISLGLLFFAIAEYVAAPQGVFPCVAVVTCALLLLWLWVVPLVTMGLTDIWLSQALSLAGGGLAMLFVVHLARSSSAFSVLPARWRWVPTWLLAATTVVWVVVQVAAMNVADDQYVMIALFSMFTVAESAALILLGSLLLVSSAVRVVEQDSADELQYERHSV